MSENEIVFLLFAVRRVPVFPCNGVHERKRCVFLFHHSSFIISYHLIIHHSREPRVGRDLSPDRGIGMVPVIMARPDHGLGGKWQESFPDAPHERLM